MTIKQPRRPWITTAQRRRQRAEEAFAELTAGLMLGPCYLLTVTRQRNPQAGWGRDLNIDMAIRGEVLTPLTCRMRRRWSPVEVWSVLEWGEVTVGVHLHAVVRGTLGVTTEWANEAIQALGQPYVAHIVPIEDALIVEGAHASEDVVTYVTKQLRMKDILDGWPRYTHLVSATQGWLPREDKLSAETGDTAA